METLSRVIALPKEVRQIILRILLVPPRMLSSPVSLLTDQDQLMLGRVLREILLTCKSIYEEGIPVRYGKNIFHLDDSERGLWFSLNSAGERNISMIRRVSLSMKESSVDSRPWSFVARAPKLFCEPPPGFPILPHIDVIVTGLGLDLHIRNEGLLNKSRSTEGVQGLFDEIARLDKETLSRIGACNLHDTSLATAIELESLGLSHLHLASAEGASGALQTGTERVLILSSRSEVPYYLSDASFVLICRLKVNIEEKRIEVLEEYDHHSAEISNALQLIVNKG